MPFLASVISSSILENYGTWQTSAKAVIDSLFIIYSSSFNFLSMILLRNGKQGIYFLLHFLKKSYLIVFGSFLTLNFYSSGSADLHSSK